MKRFSLAVLVLLILGVLGLGVGTWEVVRDPIAPPPRPLVVDDVTQLNPIVVDEVITPRTIQEIAGAVRDHDGPIAIGGGRYSMGGQIATDGALHVDLRQFDRIVEFDPDRKLITVQAGIRWRDIQERIDSADLSVAIMQSYADFTVGGALSVNAHGRYVGRGPIIESVEGLTVVLADGSITEATRERDTDLFYGVVGGYGGLGVIGEATLRLTDNVPVVRRNHVMPIADYARYFADSIGSSREPVFHNADIYPSRFETVNAVTYSATDAPLTVSDRLVPRNRSYRLNRMLFWVISEWPFGKLIRQRIIDPIRFRAQPVSWRNHEASKTVAELEPASRARSTYVLQEYFVPVDRFDAFVPLLREILHRHDVNVLNVSIRHARADPGSLLAWARTDVFAFVMYYKQETDDASRRAVGAWTRELIDAALLVGGTYYLPYQIHATEEQFLRAYPRAAEFFALKRRVDPTNKFRNRLWDRYYRAEPTAGR